MRNTKRLIAVATAALMLCQWFPLPAAAQGGGGSTARRLSIEESLSMAVQSSEALVIARAGVTTAQAQRLSSRAERLPQLSSSLSYSRTLINQFSGGGSAPSAAPSAIPACSTFAPDPALPLDQRIQLLERAIGCSAGGNPLGGLDLSRAGFGAANSYSLGLSFSQALFAGGRLQAQSRIAEAGVRSSQFEVTAQNAQLAVSVAQNYYNALLSSRLLAIAEASLAQSEQTLRLTELGLRVGDKAEYDVLRARVARNNQRTAVVQQRSSREVAFLTLKQQLDLPLDEPVELTTSLGDSVASDHQIPGWITPEMSDTATNQRVAVRQAMEAMHVQEGQLRVAQAQGRPSINITSNYGLSAYPQQVIPTPSGFRDSWSAGLAVSLPVFNSGRTRASVMQARGALEQSQARLQQTRESAELDTRTKLQALETARTAWEAMAGNVEEAQRAYDIAQLRYQQGLATLTEVNDARIALSQAQADRAQSTRDLYVAQAQLLLVRDLPLAGGGASAATTGQAASARPGGTPATR
jgi:outer membrane protein